MSEHDSASVVAGLAGLSGAPRPDVKPEQLIRRFCHNVPDGMVAAPGEHSHDGYVRHSGHCGYIGGRGDSLEVGFDDGYGFMGYLGDRGWVPLHAKGDWPYVVYLKFVHKGESISIAEYCEGDLSVYIFDSADAAKAVYADFRDCP